MTFGAIPTFLQYAVLALLLLIGYWTYDRYDWRLGGVLALPLVLVYSLVDPMLLVAFALAAAVAYLVGSFVRSQTLIYGRRLLYTDILGGLVASAIFVNLFDVGVGGIVLVVLPGIFVYNLRREGAPWRRAGQFAFIFIPLYLMAHVLLAPFGYQSGLYQVIPQAQAAVVDSMAAVAHLLGPIDLPQALLLRTADGATVAAAGQTGLEVAE